ncbi:hypothetical protein ZWY2020_041570 [Hordeum vulgare]|nr:hypothetical protein ZWY2020_041570 [Hordeum vulgare]
MPPLHDCRDGGLLVLDPAAAALFGGVRHRKRARVTAVHPRVFSAAEEALDAAQEAEARRRRHLNAPDGCLFEVLRVQAPAWRLLCVSIAGSRAGPQPVFAADEEDGRAEAASAPSRTERTLEGAGRRPNATDGSQPGERRGSHPHASSTAGSSRSRGAFAPLRLWGTVARRMPGLLRSPRLPSLEKLDITGCPLVTNKGLAVASWLPDLKTLTIESCSRVANEGLKAIGSAPSCSGVSGLICSAMPSLAKVCLRGLSITDPSLDVIGVFWVMANALGLQKLRCMSITSCPGVTELVLVSIAKFCPSLMLGNQLYLRKCNQISDGLLKDFKEASKVLENLQIEKCIRVTLTDILSFLLNCSPKFTALSLVKCTGIKDIWITVSTSLAHLSLEGCSKITDASLFAISESCPELVKLDLSNCI